MKKFLIATAAVLGATGTQAADLPVKAPYLKAPVAMVYGWTGFYVGVNAGVGLGRDFTQYATPINPSLERSYLSPQGGLGGAQAGYNWQTARTALGNIVLGVEADIQGTGLRDSSLMLVGFNATYDQRLDWFGTVRGRVGLANGPVLSYFTGGFAYGSVKTTITEPLFAGSFTSSQNRGGYTYGSGIEAALGGNWTGKIEYLYINLGGRLDNFVIGGGARALSTDVTEQVFRVGLNYRVNGQSNYVAPMAANWAGFYLGGNLGGGIARERTTTNQVGIGSEIFDLVPNGFNGGVQAGYNWQATNWVFGLEADIQGSSQRDNRACVNFCGGNGGVFVAYDAQLPWFGTARARVGYSAGSTLFYATGGYAYGSVKTNVTLALGAAGSLAFQQTKGGWTAGAGIESPATFAGVLGPGWTWKTEYLYVDLGTTSNVIPTNLAGATVMTISSRIGEHIFRTGLNYHFNSPVVAKY